MKAKVKRLDKAKKKPTVKVIKKEDEEGEVVEGKKLRVTVCSRTSSPGSAPPAGPILSWHEQAIQSVEAALELEIDRSTVKHCHGLGSAIADIVSNRNLVPADEV